MLSYAEIMAQNRNPRWRPSAILDFQKSDFWTLGPRWLPILHHCIKFGAKILIDDEIMAENRNTRWRPSAILDLSHHHIGPPTKSIHWAKIQLLNNGTPWAIDFPSLYQIWRKNVDRRRNYGRKSKYKMAAVRHLGFVTSSYRTTHEVYSLG